MTEKFIQFLKQDMGVSIDQIDLGLRNTQGDPNQLPMTLWQYGFVNLEQLDKIFDWLDIC